MKIEQTWVSSSSFLDKRTFLGFVYAAVAAQKSLKCHPPICCLPMRETHLPLMSRGGGGFLKQHLAWQITLEKQTFAKAAEATHTSWDEINSKGAF